MQAFRKINKEIRLPLAILLSLLLLCAQGVTLHVHSFEHDSFQSHHSIDNLNEHSHLNVAHLTIDASHDEHHGNVSSEIAASPNYILNQISSNMIMLALLTIILMLVLPILCRYILFHIHFNINRLWQYYFSPQL